MRNTKARSIAGAIVTVLTTAALLGVASPAQAAGTCTSGGAAGRPAALSGGRMGLWNVKHSGYTGTPFSFQMVVERGGLPGKTVRQTYTYDQGSRHSYNTDAIRSGVVVLVRTWCGGLRGGDWSGRVNTRR